MEKRQDLGIPYGVADFKTIRQVAFPRHAAALLRPQREGELRNALRRTLDRVASDAELAAKADEGIAQLRRYADDPFVPDLAKDTTLHLILFQFKGTDLVRLEEIAPAKQDRQERVTAPRERKSE